MPSAVTIKNATNSRHFYTVYDKYNNDNVVFSGNVDVGANSGPFDLADGSDGTGSASVMPAQMTGQLFYGVVDNQELVMR